MEQIFDFLKQVLIATVWNYVTVYVFNTLECMLSLTKIVYTIINSSDILATS